MTCISSLLLVLSSFDPIPKGEQNLFFAVAIARLVPKRLPDEIAVVRSSGVVVTRFQPKGTVGWIRQLLFTPNGSGIFVITEASSFKSSKSTSCPLMNLYLIDYDKPDEIATLIVDGIISPSRAVISRDGAKVYVSDYDIENSDNQNAVSPFRSWVIDAKSRKKQPLKLPEGHHICDISKDGKTFLTGLSPNRDNPSNLKKARGYLVPLKGLRPTCLLDEEFWPTRLFPDGGRVMGYQFPQPGSSEKNAKWFVLDMKEKRLEALPLPLSSIDVKISPNLSSGNTKVFMSTDGPPGWSRYEITESDLVGRNVRSIFRVDKKETIICFDQK